LEATLAKDSKAFGINERISHFVYGTGTISEMNPTHTVIDFDENGRRKFMTSMVQLEHSDVAAPAPPVKTRSKTAKPKKTKK
jgi:hypothetical protein